MTPKVSRFWLVYVTAFILLVLGVWRNSDVAVSTSLILSLVSLILNFDLSETPRIEP